MEPKIEYEKKVCQVMSKEGVLVNMPEHHEISNVYLTVKFTSEEGTSGFVIEDIVVNLPGPHPQ